MSEHKSPEDVLRDMNLKASIWRNEGEKGAYYNTTFARSYKDEAGQYHDSHTFGQQDLLRLSELSRSAYNRINDLKQDHAHTSQQNAAEKAEERKDFQEKRSAQQPKRDENARDR